MSIVDFQNLIAHTATIAFFFGVSTALIVAFLGRR